MMPGAKFHSLLGVTGILSSRPAELERHCLRSWAHAKGPSLWKTQEVAVSWPGIASCPPIRKCTVTSTQATGTIRMPSAPCNGCFSATFWSCPALGSAAAHWKAENGLFETNIQLKLRSKFKAPVVGTTPRNIHSDAYYRPFNYVKRWKSFDSSDAR